MARPTSRRRTGFIPAYAGNTRVVHSQSARYAVHPRLRGEHRQRRHAGQGERRFIPAYAGNTRVRTLLASVMPVHPRLRGEHRFDARKCIRRHGSSPLTRGTPAGAWRFVQGVRFIPAYAGNTDGKPVEFTPENGSSPLTRGTPMAGHVYRGDPRFIPAYAGNTSHSAVALRMAAVHPRLRGEHRKALRTRIALRGSSPLTRGTRNSC